MTAVPNSTASSPGEPRWNAAAVPSMGFTAGPVRALIAAGLTFGLLPAVVWPWRWATLLDRDRPFYRDLAVWWQRRVAPADGKQLDAVLNELRPRPILMVLPWLAVAFAGLTVAGYAFDYDGSDHLLAATFAYHPRSFHHAYLPARTVAAERAHLVWVWALAFAYACQWYAVRAHARAVGDLVRWTNKLARDNNLGRVPNEAGRLGLGPVWVVAGVGLCWFNAWWAIPMVMAGAAQRRYALTGTPRLQQALSTQAAQAVALAGGETQADRLCPTPHCGQRVPAAAKFCPRCGTATAPTVARS